MSISLRQPQISHASTLFALIEDAREILEQWLPSFQKIDTLPALEYFLLSKKYDDAYPAQNIFEVCYERESCGLIQVHSGDALQKKAELSYWLGKAYTGRGIMTEACKLLLHRLFGGTDLAQIKIRCHSTNQKSQGIPLRLGFHLTESLIVHDPFPTYINTFIMERDMWLKKYPFSFLFSTYPQIV